MAIRFDEKKRTFTLHTKRTTYQMQADRYGYLLHLYYGRRTEGCMEYLLTYADRGFSGNPYDAGNDRTYSLDALPQEFPCRGTGDYRSPAFAVKNADGSFDCDLRYQGYEIRKGKYTLPGLPAVYAKEDEAETLVIDLKDFVSGIAVRLLYGVLPELDIITRSAEIINEGNDRIYLEKAQSACLDFVTGNYDLISFYGRHAMERQFQRIPVAHGAQVIGSRRGLSSHQYNPAMILAESGTCEEHGGCYAMSFVYSGNFKGEAEKDQYNQTRFQLGLHDDMFSYPLEKGENFFVPEAILSYSGEGLGRLSRNLHDCVREHICRGKYKDQVRPVLLNSWEASYFDFDGNSLYELAEHAAAAGIELFVMDDGWFGKRNDDNSGLGDWAVNEEKLGETLSSLIKRVNSLGLKFGIWVEPEAVNEDSDLYREHPDWVIGVPGRLPVRGRNQLVLDFSRKDVVDSVFEKICNVLDQGNIEYLKWDMNRALANVSSAMREEPGRLLHDYVLGVYDFLERLVIRYPDMLIEGCCGGGGRFDMGMLYYAPQIWCSDNTDAVDRLLIQYGTSFCYPVSAVGSHVSAVPNHQTGRETPLHTRKVVAMSGTFGYELDLGKLSEEERQEVRSQIKDYHKYAPLIQKGEYYRLTNPHTEEAAAWEFVSKDKEEVLLNVVMVKIHGNMTPVYVCLKGLEEGAMYREEESGILYPAEALMGVGYPMPIELGAYQAYQYHFIKQDL